MAIFQFLLVLMLLVASVFAACHSNIDDPQASNQSQASEPTRLNLLDPATARARQEQSKPTPQMQAVLDELASLGGKPIENLDAATARRQPTPADAVQSLIKKGKVKAASMDDVSTAELSIPGPKGSIQTRIYTPQGDGPFPVIVYYHGGGWVIADLDTYDASARGLCQGAKAVVVSSHYRQAPEHPFPAAHDDTFAAYQWVSKYANQIKGDPMRIAVAGESAGGNMAVAVCLAARQKDIAMPVHQLLVYPVTSASLEWPSVEEHSDAKPLNKAMLSWFFDKYVPKKEDRSDPRLELTMADLKGLPPATVVIATIDPLRSEVLALADQLEDAGVRVQRREFGGVTHEFFGMAAAVDQAKEAQEFACEQLRMAFAKKSSEAPIGAR